MPSAERCQSKLFRPRCYRIARRWVEPSGRKYALLACEVCAKEHVRLGDRDGGEHVQRVSA